MFAGMLVENGTQRSPLLAVIFRETEAQVKEDLIEAAQRVYGDAIDDLCFQPTGNLAVDWPLFTGTLEHLGEGMWAHVFPVIDGVEWVP